jgi:hypothetical protein
MDLAHVAVGNGGGFRRTATILTRVQVGRVPVPPVMFGVRFLVVAVVFLGFAEEFCKSSYIHSVGLRLLPFATGKARRDFLKQPTVPVRILERCERGV